MASFVPNTPAANDNTSQFLGYSRAISPYDISSSKTSAVTYAGIGNVLKDAAVGADETIKSVIDNRVQEGVDQQREGYTGALEYIAGVPQANQVADYQPTPGALSITGSQPTAPANVQAATSQAGTIVSASQTGKFTPTYYTGRLDMLAKDIRAQFPGYREYIDQKIAQETGGNPANEYLKQLLTQINQGVANKQSELEKNLSAIRENPGIDGSEQAAINVQSGKWGTPDVVRWLNGGKGIQVKAAQMKANFEINQYDYDQGHLVAQKNLNILGDDMLQHQFVTLTSSLGGKNGGVSFDELGGILQGIDSGKITMPNEQEARGLAASLSAFKFNYESKLRQKAIESGTSGFMKPEELNAAISAKSQPIQNLIDHITHQEYGEAYHDANFIKSSTDSVSGQMLRDTGVVGKNARIASAATKLMGPNAITTIAQDAVTAGLAPGLKVMAETIKADVATQSDPNGQPVTMSDWIANLQKNKVGVDDDPTKPSQTKKSERAIYDSITNLPRKVTDPTVPDQAKANIIKGTYGAGNEKLINLFANDSFDKNGNYIPGQNALFAKLTSKDITDNVWALKTKGDNKSWEDYKNWSTQTFGQLFGTTIRNLNNINPTQLDNSHVKFSYNSDTHHFGVSFDYGGRQPTTMDKVAEQGYNSRLAFLNSGLDSMANIAKKEGGDPNALALRLIIQENGQINPDGTIPYNEGITGKLLNAVKSSAQQLKSDIQSGKPLHEIIGDRLPDRVKIFEPSMKDLKTAPQASAAPTAPDERQQYAYNYFTQIGYSPEQAAGMVGGLSGETQGLNTTQIHDNGIGFGIAGWNKERLAALRAYAAERNEPVSDLKTQLSFIKQELDSSEGKAKEAILAARTPEEASRAYTNFYERPNAGVAHLDKRMSNARRFYTQFKSQA